VHRETRKTIETRGHFPTEEASRKLIYLSIQNALATLAKHLQLERSPALAQNSTSQTDCPAPLTQEVGHPRPDDVSRR
jgi:transposase-like protein